MKEVNTILEMLIESQTQLLEAKARLKEREAEIDKDLSDCKIAIAALTPKVEVAAEQPQEQTERTPKVGDELIAICETDEFLTKGKTYLIIASSNDPKDPRFVIKDDTGNTHGFSCVTWHNYFRFANEPTPEDLANLHLYLHMNGEPKKPYRIKTRQEMIDGGAVDKGGVLWRTLPYQDYGFYSCMEHLHGEELDTNTRQEVDNFTIEPWMITENK